MAAHQAPLSPGADLMVFGGQLAKVAVVITVGMVVVALSCRAVTATAVAAGIAEVAT